MSSAGRSWFYMRCGLAPVEAALCFSMAGAFMGCLVTLPLLLAQNEAAWLPLGFGGLFAGLVAVCVVTIKWRHSPSETAGAEQHTTGGARDS
jgi:hypothetical protein